MVNDDYFTWSCIGCNETGFLDIYCPKCNGLLQFIPDSFVKAETTKSTSDYKNYIFTGRYHCLNCKEPVIITGTGYSNEFNLTYYDPDDILYTPLFFTPTIHLFKIHPKCPQKVRNEIIRSFSLFWHDIDSCVNKLRLSLELLMNSQKINKTAAIDGKKSKHKLTLHKRIDLFKKKNQKVGEILEAIKWIGNKGSHADNKLIVNEVIDAYELLEHALNELYEPPKDPIYDLAKQINKRKGAHPKW